MKPVKSLMVCLDLTEMDEFLISYAAFLCNKVNSIDNVHFIHNIGFKYAGEAKEIMGRLKKPLEELIKDVIEKKIGNHLFPLPENLDYQIHVEEFSSTPNGLASLSKANNIDLTLVGKKEKSLGSGFTSQKLLRLSDFHSSLLAIPAPAKKQISNILAPTDFSKSSKLALEMGAFLKQHFQANLKCQHVFSIPAHYFPYIPVKNMEKSLRKEAEKEWKRFTKGLSQISPSDLDCEFTFNHGRSVAETIYQYAKKDNRDLIVVSSKGKGALTTLIIGSVAMRLVQNDPPIPLLVVRKREKK